MAELGQDEYDNPFSPENAVGLSLIVQMRIYDVLVAVLNKLDPETADMLYEAHQNGQIVSALPAYVPESEVKDVE